MQLLKPTRRRRAVPVGWVGGRAPGRTRTAGLDFSHVPGRPRELLTSAVGIALAIPLLFCPARSQRGTSVAPAPIVGPVCARWVQAGR